jgi:hypothetical protein
VRCSWDGSFPSDKFSVDGDGEAESVGGVVAGSEDWIGCGLGVEVGLIGMLLDSLVSDLAEYHGSLRCW